MSLRPWTFSPMNKNIPPFRLVGGWVSTHSEKIWSSNWVHLAQVGVNIKHIWNHHLVFQPPQGLDHHTLSSNTFWVNAVAFYWGVYSSHRLNDGNPYKKTEYFWKNPTIFRWWDLYTKPMGNFSKTPNCTTHTPDTHHTPPFARIDSRLEDSRLTATITTLAAFP